MHVDITTIRNIGTQKKVNILLGSTYVFADHFCKLARFLSKGKYRREKSEKSIYA